MSGSGQRKAYPQPIRKEEAEAGPSSLPGCLPHLLPGTSAGGPPRPVQRGRAQPLLHSCLELLRCGPRSRGRGEGAGAGLLHADGDAIVPSSSPRETEKDTSPSSDGKGADVAQGCGRRPAVPRRATPGHAGQSAIGKGWCRSRHVQRLHRCLRVCLRDVEIVCPALNTVPVQSFRGWSEPTAQ